MAERTAVYRLYDIAHTLLYIGESDDPGEREGWHRATQPWGRRIHHRSDEWYGSVEDAYRAETEAIETERPLYNVAKSPYRVIVGADGVHVAVTKAEAAQAVMTEKLQRPKQAGSATWMTTPEVATLANPPTTRHTVEREIRRGNIRATRFSRQWLIDLAEAERWASHFKPYAGLRKPAAS